MNEIILYWVSFYCDLRELINLKKCNKKLNEIIKIKCIPLKYYPKLRDHHLKKFLYLESLSLVCGKSITDEGIKNLLN